ncbi:right-handed parallel beta-helix repeat-containing protein [Cellulomonas sp. 179-A 4D5 NHS]|uniref:right-handed parallel beta-helix repeat-containing protein n=1 Tax=Cellulomonas sp. 179-A 4D5 NHS TaxID=3142378 RepID=UPI0039A1EC8D
MLNAVRSTFSAPTDSLSERAPQRALRRRGRAVALVAGLSVVAAIASTAPAAGAGVAPAALTIPTLSNASASTTGVPAGTVLTVITGDLVVSTPGAVIDAVDVRGFLKVTAPNVTIKRSVVRGRPITSSFALVTNGAGLYPFTIEDSELVAADASPHIAGIIGHNFTVRRTEIANVIDSVHITGSNVLVEDSYMHSNLYYASDPNHKGGESHADSIQIQGGSNIRILRNNIRGAQATAIQTTQDRSQITGLTIKDNRIGGGKCTINMAYGSRPASTGVVIQNNVFRLDTGYTRCAILAPTVHTIANVDNYFTDGAAVKVQRSF